MSLKQQILSYLKEQYPAYVHKGVIGKKAVLEWGYENENAGRRCRELENAGVIEKDPNSYEAIYRYVPQKEVEKEAEQEKMFEVGRLWN